MSANLKLFISLVTDETIRNRRSALVRKISIATSLVLCSVVANAQRPATGNFSARVDALAKRMLSRPVAGLSIAGPRRGQVVFARGNGTAMLEHSLAGLPEPVFHTSSI